MTEFVAAMAIHCIALPIAIVWKIETMIYWAAAASRMSGLEASNQAPVVSNTYDTTINHRTSYTGLSCTLSSIVRRCPGQKYCCAMLHQLNGGLNCVIIVSVIIYILCNHHHPHLTNFQCNASSTQQLCPPPSLAGSQVCQSLAILLSGRPQPENALHQKTKCIASSCTFTRPNFPTHRWSSLGWASSRKPRCPGY